jgi:hypothetical protein
MASQSLRQVVSLWSPTTQATTYRVRRHRAVHVQTFRSFRPTKLPGRPLPRPGVGSHLPGGERRLFLNPLQDRPDGDSIQPMQPPQPALDRPAKSALSALPYTAPWVPRPHKPTGLAVVLLVPVPIPSVLDDVHTPASAAPVSQSLLNHGTYMDASRLPRSVWVCWVE